MTHKKYTRRSSDKGKIKPQMPSFYFKEKIGCGCCEKTLEDRCKAIFIFHKEKMISAVCANHVVSGRYPRDSYRIHGRIVYNPRKTDKPY